MLLFLKEFVRSLPAILAMLIELKKLWDDFIHIQDRKKKIEELRDAIKEARETKNTEKIEALLKDILSD